MTFADLIVDAYDDLTFGEKPASCHGFSAFVLGS
jgi:hypothetical protein